MKKSNKLDLDKSKYKKISLSTPFMSDEGYEMQFVEEAFRSNWIAPLGPMVDAFEQDIINYTHGKYAVALSSGTAAIHLALKALGVNQGDIVFCQSLTFSASANPIIYEKAIPVFIDSEEKTWNMSPKFLNEAFDKYPKVKAVIVVHLYGVPAQIDEIISLCKKYNVPLIEDAAESLGSTYKGKATGTFGDIGIYSFNGNKIITTSGGGMAISNDKDKIEKIRFWATQARDKARHYQHSELGYNYRMSNVSAAIGRGQMKVLDKRVNKRRSIYKLYHSLLSKNNQIKMIQNDESIYFANFWLSTILLKSESKVIPLIEYLETFNIETRPLWKPMHLQPFFSSYTFIGDRTSERLFKHGICLPSDSKLSKDDIYFISSKINDFFKNE
jgi:dTDP-4-amino-4,6-dideoxygalactose transaminase